MKINKLIIIILWDLIFLKICVAKYIEGHIKTLEDWIFVVRFCFLSGRGKYEYEIEFERRFGEPQLLLYYDDKSQWPAVYKTKKTCQEKISVLKPIDNQIVTLSTRSPYSFQSGCILQTFSPNKSDFDDVPQESPPKVDDDDDHGVNASFFDKFLKSSELGNAENESYDFFETLNDTDVFNSTKSEHNFVRSFDSDYVLRNPIENNTKYMEYAEEIFNMDTNSSHLRIKRYKNSQQNTLIVTCRSSGGFLTVRERWWYIAIANCGNKKGIDVKYKFRMTNGPPGDYWHEHFSADEMYIPAILLAEVLIYTILLLAIFVCAIELKTRNLFHCTYRLFGLSVLMQYCGVILLGVAWAKYAVYGIGPYTIFGSIFLGISEILYLTLLLLMAKGYTITRARLSTCSTVKLTVFINVYTVIYITLFIYREEVFDPGEVLNLYESPAGFGLAALRCGAWGAFLVSTATTVKKFPEKSIFFYPFGILGSLWILGIPIFTFIGIGFLDPWVRESIMHGILAVLSICGHASFLWLTWPSRANLSFPYHVRTNHVGITTSDNDSADYPRHIYEPSTAGDNSDQLIIPLSKKNSTLDAVYNQYLREQEYYHSLSTPRSYASFPENCGNKKEESVETELQETSIIDENRIETVDGHNLDVENIESSVIKKLENVKENAADIIETECQKPVDSVRPITNNPFVISSHRLKNIPNKIILEPLNIPPRKAQSPNGGIHY